MRDFSSFSNHELLGLFNYLMAYDSDDFGKTVRQLAKSYPNDFWPIYREVEHRKIYEKPDDVTFIGIVGTRRRDTKEDLLLTLSEFVKIPGRSKSVIVSGLCPSGGDRFATIIYQKNESMKLWFPAEWSLGRHAGFVRNTEIARWSDWLIATPASDRKGGTEDTIKKFTRFHGGDKLIIV
jgi:hypothetical protein